MGKAEEIPIICLRPHKRMFKLKSQPPLTLASLSLTIRFMRRWGFPPPFSLHWPYAPTVSQRSRRPEGLTSSTFWLQTPTRADARAHTRVAFLCSAGVVAHCQAYKTQGNYKNITEMHTKVLAKVRFCALLVLQDKCVAALAWHIFQPAKRQLHNNNNRPVRNMVFNLVYQLNMQWDLRVLLIGRVIGFIVRLCALRRFSWN